MPLKVTASKKGVKGSGSLKPEVRQLKRQMKQEIRKARAHAKATAKSEVEKLKTAVMNNKDVKRVIKRSNKLKSALK